MKREFDASKEFKSDYYKRERNQGFLNSLARMLNLSRPLSAQDTIPIRAMYQDGLFELPNSEYSKSWRITDVNFNMESDEKKDSIDMCQAMEDNDKKIRIVGAIEMLRMEGTAVEAIIAKVMKVYNVTREYVMTILNAQVA